MRRSEVLQTIAEGSEFVVTDGPFGCPGSSSVIVNPGRACHGPRVPDVPIKLGLKQVK